MKKSIHSLILSIVLLLPSLSLFSQGYEIRCRLHGSRHGYATLRLYHRDGNETLDSISINQDGRFTFRGPIKESIPALLTINGKRPYRLYISPESNIDIDIKPSGKKPLTIKGSPMTHTWQQIITPDPREDKSVHLARLNNWVNNHPDHIFSPDIIATYLSHTWDYPTLSRSLNTLQGEALNTYHYRHLKEYLSQISRLQAGQTAPDFSSTDLNGHPVRFGAIQRQNKYSLLFFWASWDKNSRALIPQISTIYTRYKPHGLEILGLSLDTDQEQWHQTVKTDKMNWLQGQEAASWNSPVLKAYNIKSLPTFVLVDENNKILIITDELNKVSNLLNKQTKEDGFTIDGCIEEVDEGLVSMDILQKGGIKESQQCRIINGCFHFEGKTSHPCMATIHLPAKAGDISFFMNNEPIIISGSMSGNDKLRIEGSPTNDTFLHLSARCNNRKNPMQCLMNYAMEHPSSIYTPFIISSYLAPYLQDEDLHSLVSKLTGEATDMYQYSLLQEHLQRKDYTNPTGEKIRDAVLQNEKGQDIRILEEASKHDYTLISLWAPWDQKSLNNIKQLRQLYNSHTDAHFHIISISLDDNAADWRNTIQSQGMTWTNLSEHKRWNSDIVKLYSIDHIPQHILIDRNGTVISKNPGIETISKLIKPKKTNHQSKNKIK